MVAVLELSAAQEAAIDRAAYHFGFTEDETMQFEQQLLEASYQERELALCAADRQYFIEQYVQIYDSVTKDWIPFVLWEAQLEALEAYIEADEIIALKCRQIGLSWLYADAIALHEMLFRPIAAVLVFSEKESMALYQIGEERLRGTYAQLPEWMKPGTVKDNDSVFRLTNGSTARAFASNSGDSFVGTLAIVDEADLVPDLESLLRRVRPTVNAGGKLVLISRSDKSKPGSHFKTLYREIRDGKPPQKKSIFIPWYAHPGRDQAWYERECAYALQTTGSLDSVHEQYPATDEEAMNPASLHKRIPAAWVDQCWQELEPIDINPLFLEDLVVYHLPEKFRKYVGGMDCAEGLPTSDDSVTSWADAETGEMVAVLGGKFTPAVHAAYSAKVSQWYNNAKIMIENNNHGHAAILWMNDNGYSSLVMKGHNSKEGWTSNSLGKALMYDTGAELSKDGDYIIHHPKTRNQLKAIEKSTLRAPQGEGENSLDDYADSWVLTLEAIKGLSRNTYSYRQAATNFGEVQRR